MNKYFWAFNGYVRVVEARTLRQARKGATRWAKQYRENGTLTVGEKVGCSGFDREVFACYPRRKSGAWVSCLVNQREGDAC